ncbi:MAG: hypothetical protein M0024_03630 [Nitrospiraceae bacterium]|nr:hypothetical protein [Nitrospiraceae bacterium]
MLPAILALAILSAPIGCVTPGMKAGAIKNSLPVTAPDMLEEVHTIAIPAFYGDSRNWKEVAYEVIFPSKRVTVVPPDRVDAAIRKTLPGFGSLQSQDRGAALAGLRTALKADAVMNGMILPGDDRAELIIQLISLTDGRILFWQSVDLSPKDGPIDHAAKKAVLEEMLGPVLERAGKRQRPAPVVVPPREVPKPQPAVEPSEPLPRHDAPPRPEKRLRRPRPSLAPETISPM